MTITIDQPLHGFPFATAYHLFRDERARTQWLHFANGNAVCPYATLRALHEQATKVP